jgi:phosphonate transport system permease protein
MKTSPILQSKNLTYCLPNQSSPTRTIDLAINAGEMVLLTGPSGCGKTCFLDLVEGLIEPSSGSIARHVPVVRIHQDLRLVKERSVLRNVLDGLVGERSFLETWKPSELDFQLALHWIKELNLLDKKDEPVYLLSAGEAQRVAIARALIASPMLLLADEPFSALDSHNADKVMILIEAECIKRGMAALIVTHKVCDYINTIPIKILALLRGGSPDELNILTDPVVPSYKTYWTGAIKHLILKMFGHKILAKPVSILSEHSGEIAVLAFTALSFFWLYPAFQAQNFSFDMLGQFFKRWVPTFEQLQLMPWKLVTQAILDTIAMAGFATVIAVFISLPIAILATKGFAPYQITIGLRYFLNWWRAIPSIIWALICVSVMGLGILSGLIALILYSMGYLTKFFYEAFEQVDRKPALYLRSIGGSRLQAITFGLWPVALRPILSSGLFMFEYNLRAASILGVVGAGGIGVILKESVEWSNWHVVGIIIFLMGLMVIIIDWFSGWLRHSLTPERAASHTSNNI